MLFLDELPEFRRNVLEALRQPLEERAVTIVRVRGSFCIPARFQLVAAMNPCPCGNLGDRLRGCGCTPSRLRSYRARVSGPLLDRIDLQVEVPALPYEEMAGPPGEGSAAVAHRAAGPGPPAPGGGRGRVRQRRSRAAGPSHAQPTPKERTCCPSP